MLHALNPPRSAFLFQQSLARCHPYILFQIFTLVSLIFSLTVSFSTNRGLPSLALRMVFLPSTDGYTWILPGYCSRVPYIYAHVLDLAAKIRMRKIELVTRQKTSGCRPLKGTNCLFASKDHVRPVSKRLCIIFMACSCPNVVLGRNGRKRRRKSRFPYITLAMYFRQFVSVIGYRVTRTRWSDT